VTQLASSVTAAIAAVVIATLVIIRTLPHSLCRPISMNNGLSAPEVPVRRVN